MRKILSFGKLTWMDIAQYRGEALVYFLLELISSLYLILLWLSMERSGSTDHTTTVFLISYQIFSMIIVRIASSHFEDHLIDTIKDGSFSSSLTKPYDFTLTKIFEESLYRINGSFYLAPILVLIFLSIGSYISPVTWQGFLFVIPLLVISYFQRCFISLLISSTAFWIDQSKSLVHLKWMAEGILGGGWLPIMLYPKWFQDISSWTPFYYWYHVPINFLTGSSGIREFLPSLLESLLWAILLGGLFVIAWRTAIRHYGATGS